MANWTNPTLTSTYTNFVTEVKDRDIEAAVWFEGMSPTNLPINAKRLNTSTGKFEKWNGSAWVDAVATFAFPALSVAGAATITGALTLNGGIANNPTLTAGTANGVAFLNASKVLTTGSALTFDGTTFGVNTGGTGLLNLGGSNSYGAIYPVGAGAASIYLNGPSRSGFEGQAQYGATIHTWFNETLGQERMRLTSTGLGIGTSSPAYKLDVESSTINPTIRVRSSGGAIGNYAELLLQSFNSFSGVGQAYVRGVSTASGNSNTALTFGVNNSGFGAPYEAMRIDAFGNLGLGVIPSAWGSGFKTLQVLSSSIFSSNDDLNLASNVYVDSAGTSRYLTSFSYPTKYEMYNGVFKWHTSLSTQGAGNAIAFTQAMTLDASGNLGIGTASPTQKLHVSGSTPYAYIDNATAVAGTYGIKLVSGATHLADFTYNSATGENRIGGLQSYVFSTFYSGGAERMRLDSFGNLTANASVTGHWQIPQGTTAQRTASPASGMMRFNTSLTRYEGHNGSAWSSIGGGATGGGSDDVFYENGQTVTTNYTISTSKNAMSAGPITIASGITVTVPSGSTWVVI